MPAYLVLVIVTALCVGLSGIAPHDRATWAFELVPGVLFVSGLTIAAVRNWRFASLVYAGIAVQMVVLAIGAQWTYAEAPPGAWLQALFGLDRNPFDRIGHFLQGFAPALFVRELLIRRGDCRRGGLLSLVCICCCLGFSAFYEILEWAVVAAFYPHAGPEWLGMQGDPWDAQGDMLMAWLGATCAVLALSRWHDVQLRTAQSRRTSTEQSSTR